MRFLIWKVMKSLVELLVVFPIGVVAAYVLMASQDFHIGWTIFFGVIVLGYLVMVIEKGQKALLAAKRVKRYYNKNHLKRLHIMKSIK